MSVVGGGCGGWGPTVADQSVAGFSRPAAGLGGFWDPFDASMRTVLAPLAPLPPKPCSSPRQHVSIVHIWPRSRSNLWSPLEACELNTHPPPSLPPPSNSIQPILRGRTQGRKQSRMRARLCSDGAPHTSEPTARAIGRSGRRQQRGGRRISDHSGKLHPGKFASEASREGLGLLGGRSLASGALERH